MILLLKEISNITIFRKPFFKQQKDQNSSKRSFTALDIDTKFSSNETDVNNNESVSVNTSNGKMEKVIRKPLTHSTNIIEDTMLCFVIGGITEF